ncbi:MAG TPA: hypothetical protein VJM74_02225 [Nitrososphaeraceae archaeon]|nr:hypothetical protein [Nitrososphaeraceae archaeon]
MKWISVKEELPTDDLRVLLLDKNGYVTIGTRDEESGYTDDYCSILYDIEYWGYIPGLFIPVITNDDCVSKVLKLNN